MKYWSQHGEDKWIVENLTLPDHGVYVDIGAADPLSNSNTAFLRDRGWYGLCVDGDKRWLDHWNEVKNCIFVCEVVSPTPMVNFRTGIEPWISRVIDDPQSSKIGTTDIEFLLRQHSITKIDFLSIDIEGHEFDVLDSMDLDAHSPDIIVAEYNTREIGEDFRVRDLLTIGHGYNVVHQNLSNIIYAR